MKPILKSCWAKGILLCLVAFSLARVYAALTKRTLIPAPPRTLVPAPPTPRIVFTDKWSGDVWIMDLQGRSQTKITNNPKLTFMDVRAQPAISPDRRQVVFSVHRGRGRDSDLGIVNIDGSQQADLTDTKEQNERLPQWSSDGKKIVFFSSLSQISDAPSVEMSINADGTERKNISENEKRRLLSTNGKTVIVPSFGDFRRSRSREFYFANADGSEKTLLPLNDPSKAYFAYQVRLSPDATKIVFVSGFRQTAEICVIDADGTNRRQLTSNAFEDNEPVFTPDSKQIVFASNSQRRDADFRDERRRNASQATDDNALRQRRT